MKLEFKELLQRFSSEWEDYVEKSIVLEDGKSNFRVFSDHIAYRTLFSDIQNSFKSIVDNNRYKVDASVGDGNLAVIPWVCIMNREITDSTTKGYYLSYLFSRNAKKLFLSIGLGATQFSELFGQNKSCVDKISQAKREFENNFLNYSPLSVEYSKIDLMDETDQSFIRSDIGQSPKFKIAAYEAGCFFSKIYDIEKGNFTNDEFYEDFLKYMNAYEKIYINPKSEALIEILAESVFDEKEKSHENLNYEVPEFTPVIKEKKEKKENLSNYKRSNITSRETKKTGIAGEEYVYRWEVNRLKKQGREDLASKVIKQFEDLSTFPGYDIKSFDNDGNEIFIEVKSTKGKNKEIFDITHNEWQAAKIHGKKFWIYIVVNALTKPIIQNRIENPNQFVNDGKLQLTPSIYKLII